MVRKKDEEGRVMSKTLMVTVVGKFRQDLVSTLRKIIVEIEAENKDRGSADVGHDCNYTYHID